MTKIETGSGFVIEVNEAVIDDMELLELVGDVSEGNITQYGKLASKLLGEEGKKALYAHLRNSEGRVPIEAFSNELSEILGGLQTKKK